MSSRTAAIALAETIAREKLGEWIVQWEPPKRPSCSNCLHAKVRGNPVDPTVACDLGHGRTVDLARLIRPIRPVGIASAETCPDFSSMGEGDR